MKNFYSPGSRNYLDYDQCILLFKKDVMLQSYPKYINFFPSSFNSILQDKQFKTDTALNKTGRKVLVNYNERWTDYFRLTNRFQISPNELVLKKTFQSFFQYEFNCKKFDIYKLINAISDGYLYFSSNFLTGYRKSESYYFFYRRLCSQ